MTRLFTFLLVLLAATAVHAADLKPGAYTLELVVPELPPWKDGLKLEGTLEPDEDEFEFHTKAADGKNVVILGKVTEKGLLMWISADERGSLITFHYTGKTSDEPGLAAEGQLSIFQDHERVAGGTWKLRLTK